MRKRINSGPKASRKKKDPIVETPKVVIPFKIGDPVVVKTDAVSQKTQKPLDGRTGFIWEVHNENEILVKINSTGFLRKDWVPTEILPFALTEIRELHAHSNL